jgi:hypothetical protein
MAKWVLFWSEPKSPWWKVVLGRELRNHQVIANTYDDYIDARNVKLETLLELSDLDNTSVLIGTIELNKEEIVLTIQALWVSLEMDNVA